MCIHCEDVRNEFYPNHEAELRTALQATLEALKTTCSPSQVLGAIKLAKSALAVSNGDRASG